MTNMITAKYDSVSNQIIDPSQAITPIYPITNSTGQVTGLAGPNQSS